MQSFDDSRNHTSHKRAIVYVNTDLLSLLPDVGNSPAALRWEDRVLACNKAARNFGVSDNQPFKTAVQLCPSLIVLGAEHISPLAEIVNKVNKFLRTYSCSLERVNVDECYLDITSHPLLSNARSGITRATSDESCPCGCYGLLSAAHQLGDQLQTTLVTGMRVRARTGVSCSKLLARLAAFRSSFDQPCRLVLPHEVGELILRETLVNVLPGKIAALLQARGIHTVADIRTLSLDDLQREVGLDDAVTAANAAYGIDTSPVLTRDVWRSFCVEYEIREKFCVLLMRIFGMVEEDGRTPVALKVSVRKWDPLRKTCSKEAKTAPISCGVRGRPTQDVMMKLMNVIMTCFRRLVDMTRPFQLSLLGLAFVRFQECSPRLAHPSMRSVASCLLRKRELSVEAPVNVSFEGDGSPPPRIMHSIDQQDCSDAEELPQNEKKAKLDIFIKSKRFHDERMDEGSPSKLRVADLSLSEDKAVSRSLMHW